MASSSTQHSSLKHPIGSPLVRPCCSLMARISRFSSCAIRDLLRLRRTLGIQHGAVVVGEDAHHAASESNAKEAVGFLRAVRRPSDLRRKSTRTRHLCGDSAPVQRDSFTTNSSCFTLRKANERSYCSKAGRMWSVLDLGGCDVFCWGLPLMHPRSLGSDGRPAIDGGYSTLGGLLASAPYRVYPAYSKIRLLWLARGPPRLLRAQRGVRGATGTFHAKDARRCNKPSP